jgi:hypothetical protein
LRAIAFDAFSALNKINVTRAVGINEIAELRIAERAVLLKPFEL